MKKYIFSLATLALFSLEAAQYQHKTTITLSNTETEQPEYLVQFEIDQIDENAVPVEVTKPQVLCQLGTESVFTKEVEGKGGYTVKALVYKDEIVKAKTSIVLYDENLNEVYTVEEETEVNS
jgi:hypothetical protein